MTCDITVKKLNEVYVKIQCEKSIAKELHEHFSFFVPGYQFVPAYKNRIWNGKIYLYHLNTSQFYIGLIPYLKEFCNQDRSHEEETHFQRSDLKAGQLKTKSLL